MTVYQRAASTGPWTDLSLAANWEAYGATFSAPRWRRVGDRIELAGLLKRITATAASGTAHTIAGLAAGMVPTNGDDRILSTVAYYGTSLGTLACQIRIDESVPSIYYYTDTGSTLPISPSGWVTLDGLSYSLS
jgi:hypothetical protein